MRYRFDTNGLGTPPATDHFLRKHSGIHTALAVSVPASLAIWGVILHALNLI